MMYSIPIDVKIVSDIFGSPYHEEVDQDDPSSDYAVVLDWLSEQINPDFTQMVEVPLRVKNSLRTIGSCNDWMFDKFSGMIRRKLNTLSEDEGSLVGYEWLEILLRHISNLSELLHRTYEIVGLNSTQERLMERLEDTVFQSWVNKSTVLQAIKRVYEDNLFSDDTTTSHSLVKLAGLLNKIDLDSELTLLLLDTAHSRIKMFVNDICAHSWNKPRLSRLLSWVKDELFPRMDRLVPDDEFSAVCLVEIAKIELAKLRTDEIFDIVIDYPDSKCALEEVRLCLGTAEQQSRLVESFIFQSKKRLLHAGTDSTDIISCYISAIRSFLIIDHRGVLLDKACRPIRNYLKSRKDTVQRIVYALLNTSPENKLIELAIELRNSNNRSMAHNETERVLEWVPDPVDALPDFRKGVVEDIVESLISIFESKDLFVEEFVKVFSERLLQVTNYDVRDIYNDMHLLKSRFGNQEFNSLDVMLKDMLQSKSIDRKLKGKAPDNVHASIISHLYWPKLPKYSFKLPEEVNAAYVGYQKAYEAHKRGRKLLICPSLSKVNLSLEIKGTSHKFLVTADKAAIIYFFQEQPPKSRVKLGLLCMRLQLPLKLAKEGLKYWTSQAVLSECGLNEYRVNE
ncbi:hypothetical protein FOA43_003657 [Brettanomyces nanus]|uniref:Cullin family profile domain-containing protein n=1 Tax=Eeniella nana TaxID=13502 RepID=A0A875S3L2_EENNA|nr:uncharacterized protein FOA43_003657 [Brettanomyces nanus]QPG76271.1 hypothetical protein FOA43_003657 [Brettanomyces nanus]